MNKRFVQAHKEARWALGLTLIYVVAWLLSAYLPDNKPGITGLPHWFELACLAIPALFIVLCWLMITFVYRDISLENDNSA